MFAKLVRKDRTLGFLEARAALSVQEGIFLHQNNRVFVKFVLLGNIPLVGLASAPYVRLVITLSWRVVLGVLPVLQGPTRLRLVHRMEFA